MSQTPAALRSQFPAIAHVPDNQQSAALYYVCYIALIFFLVVFAAVRFHFRSLPLERDEGEFAYMGQLLLQGVAPYKLAFTMKLPGTCMAYAAMMAAFGQTASGIRLGMIVVTTVCAVFVFLLGRGLYGILAGTIAGISYVFLAIRPGVLGMEAHATHFVVLTALAGVLLLLRAIQNNRTSWFLASGLCFGLAFLMKQPGIFFGFFAASYWLGTAWKQGLRWKLSVARGSLIFAGMGLPFGLLCLWMQQAGVFSNFWFWTWTYARAYGSIVKFHDMWQMGLKWTLPWAVRPFVLWEVALAGLSAPLWNRAARTYAGFTTGFFVTSCLAVCPGFYFRPHYYILLLPAVSLCIGIAVQSVRRQLQESKLAALAGVPVLLFVLAYLLSLHGQWKTYFHLDPDSLSRKMYEDGQAFPEDVSVADVIKTRASPQDRIGILGSEPEICFYTQLRCATPYLYMYPLMEKQEFARQMQQDMMQRLSHDPPRFLVYVDGQWSWNWKPTLAENRAFLDQAWNFAHAGYKVVDMVPVKDTGSATAHLWGDQPMIYVFERIDP